MYNTSDLYLGTFLILCGFALSLFNLRRVVRGTAFSSLLLSENMLLMCIGVAFISRAVYSFNLTNMEIHNMEERIADLVSSVDNVSCGFTSLLLGYGPLVVSMVNSFLSLIIDNYMHFKMLGNIKEKADENIVREIREDVTEGQFKYERICNFWKKNVSILTIAVHWIVPIITALAMYPVGVKEITMLQARNLDESCTAMLDLYSKGCNATDFENNATDQLKYIQSPVNFFEIQDNENMSNASREIDSVLNNVLKIINNFNNHTNFNFTTLKSIRHPKANEKCMKMCYTDNKGLLLYMFVVAVVSYFIPITISTIILTKIHVMDVKKPNMKTYVTRELLYNILFWTPVMFDTFLSLIFCSYSMHGIRTSIFNIIANIYQAFKNFMNTKYFKENVIVPV